MCSEEQEFLIRTLISQSTNKTDASLISIETTDLEDERIRITATFNVPKGATFLYNRKFIKSFRYSLQTFVLHDTLYYNELRWSYESA